MTRHKRSSTADQALTWITLWRQIAPAKYQRQARHKEQGGELKFAWETHRRKWRFDWCLPEFKVAVEIDGGKAMAHWSKKLRRCVVVGRHNRDPDLEKHNAACELGWIVFHFSPAMLKKNGVQCVEQVLTCIKLLL